MGKFMIWEKALECQSQGLSYVMVTLIDARGSIPQEIGAKCLVTSKGLYAGTVGGGKVEAEAIQRSLKILSSEKQVNPIIVTWNLQRDIKMTCGGEAKFLFEHFPARVWPIALFGAGHVGQALSKTLRELNCQLTVVDSRQEWLDKIQGVNKICHENPHELVSSFSPHTFFISMTQGHAFDVPVLFEIYKHFPKAPYIGVIGSDTKGRAIKNDLRELGVDEDFLNHLRIPIGLPLGTNQPPEISISIAAELIQIRDKI
jgi:xanthine dehydrogenase accessory factor